MADPRAAAKAGFCRQALTFGSAIGLLAGCAILLCLIQLHHFWPDLVEETPPDAGAFADQETPPDVGADADAAGAADAADPGERILNYDLSTWRTSEFTLLSKQESDQRVREGRVAVCIMGQMRTLYTDWQVQRIVDEVVEPFQADVFLVVSPDIRAYDVLRRFERMNGTRVISDGTDKRNYRYDTTFKVLSLEEVGRRLAAKAIRTYSGQPSSKESHTCKHKSYYPYHASFWTLKYCHELVTSHEQSNGFRYDWIVKQRPDVAYGFWPAGHPKRKTHAAVPVVPKQFPDVVIRDPTPRVFGAHGWVSGCMFCDMFHLVSRSAFDIYVGVSDAYRYCSSTVKIDKKGFSCHCQDNSKKDKVTDGKTLECFWMRWLWQNNVSIHLNGGGARFGEWTRGCAYDLFLETAGVTTKLLRNLHIHKHDVSRFKRVVMAKRVCCR